MRTRHTTQPTDPSLHLEERRRREDVRELVTRFQYDNTNKQVGTAQPVSLFCFLLPFPRASLVNVCGDSCKKINKPTYIE